MPLETVDLDGVDVLSAGGPYHGAGSPAGGDFYTEADLRKIAASHELLGPEIRPRNLVGHDPRQPMLAASGLYGDDQLPAAGWLTNFRVDGGKLRADVKRVPRKLADLIGVGAFRTRSVGIKKLTSQQTGEKHLVIDHLAWLGKKAPAVRNLDDIAALYGDDGPTAGWIEEPVAEYQYDAPGRVSRLPADTTGEMPEEITLSAETIVALAERMGVDPEDVDDASLVGYADELAAKAETPDDDDGDGDGDGDEKPEGETGMVKLSETDVSELREQAAAGQRAARELHEMRRDSVIDTAIEACKIPPAAREEWQKRYDEAEGMVTTILSELSPDTELLTTYGADGDGLDESAREAKEKDEDELYRRHMADDHGVTVQTGEAN